MCCPFLTPSEMTLSMSQKVLRVERSSFTSFDKSLFVLLLSLFSEVEDFLIATVLSSLGHPLQTKGGLI